MIDHDYRLDLAASSHMEGPDGECPQCGMDAMREEYARTGRCNECRRHRAAAFAVRMECRKMRRFVGGALVKVDRQARYHRVRRDRRTLRAAILWRELAGKRNGAMCARERVTVRRVVRCGR